MKILSYIKRKFTTHKKVIYLVLWTLIIALPLIYIWLDKSFMQGPPPGERMEMRDGNRPPAPPYNPNNIPDFTQQQPPQRQDLGNGETPPPKPNGMDMPPEMRNGEPPEMRNGNPPMDWQRLLAKIMFSFLIIGGYGGVIYFFRKQHEQKAEPIIQPIAQQEPSSSEAPQQNEGNDFIFVKSEYRMVRIDIPKIRYVEGMSEYLRLFLEGEPKPVIALLSMKKLEERLPKNFMRVHRSYIVNLQKIQQVERGRIVMDKDTYIPVSDGYKDAFNQYMSQQSLEK
jgi:hypothetical protein